jgi:hypothetical protein
MRISTTLAVLTATLALAAHAPAITPDQMRADLEAAAAALWDTHPYLSDTVEPDAWAGAVAEVEAAIPALSDAGFYLAIQRLAAFARDGHTNALPTRPDSTGPAYPVRFRLASDGLLVMDAAPEYADAVGARVVSMYGREIPDLFTALEPHFPGDNPVAAAGWSEIFIRFPMVMQAAGIATEGSLGTTLVVETEAGEERSFELTPMQGDPRAMGPAPEVWPTIRDDWAETPLPERQSGERHWFTTIDDGATLYVRYREVQDDEDETIAAFAERLWAFAAEHDEIERIVFDVRGNGGGNNYLNQPLILGLVRSRFDEPGGSFCLIDCDTFSAAMNFVGELERLTHTIFVGEPTGAGPNHAGDSERFMLEHSGIMLRVSQLWWQFSDPRDPRKWVRPDIAAPLDMHAWRTGEDPGLAAIRTFGEVPSHLTGRPASRWQRLTQRRPWQGLVGGFDGAWTPFAPVGQ